MIGVSDGQNWDKLTRMLQVYPYDPAYNLTDGLLRANFTVLKLFQEANNFFTSLGFDSLDSFFDDSSGSVLRIKDEPEFLLVNFRNGSGSIKVSLTIDSDGYEGVHSLLTEALCLQLRREQPYIFQEVVNPGKNLLSFLPFLIYFFKI